MRSNQSLKVSTSGTSLHEKVRSEIVGCLTSLHDSPYAFSDAISAVASDDRDQCLSRIDPAVLIAENASLARVMVAVTQNREALDPLLKEHDVSDVLSILGSRLELTEHLCRALNYAEISQLFPLDPRAVSPVEIPKENPSGVQ